MMNALARASDLKTIPPIEKQPIYGNFACTYKPVFCYWNTWLQDSFDLTMTFIRGKIRIYVNDELKNMCRGNYTSQLCVCILREQVRQYQKSALTPNLPQENSAGAQPGAKFELLATNITRNK